MVRHTKVNGVSSFTYGFCVVQDDISDDDEPASGAGSEDDELARGVPMPLLDDLDVDD